MSSSPEFSPDTTNWQRIAIGAGTLLVVALTVVAAIFLALQDAPDQPTVVGVVSPSLMPPVITPAAPTAIIIQPTFTPSATPLSVATLTLTPTPLPPVKPTSTPPPVVATNTPAPVPPTATLVPAPPKATPVPPTATFVPAPPPDAPAPAGGGTCQPPASWVNYVTQTGDTLNSLAERTNVSVYDLQQVNCLESYTIQPGQKIYLPFTPPTPTVTNTPTPEPPTPTPTRTPTPTSTPLPPEIFSTDPTQGVNTEDVIIAVQGRYFKSSESGFRVELRLGSGKRTLALGELKNSTSFEVIVPVGLTPGTYDLWVINPDSQFDTQRSAYTVLAPTPTP